MTDLNHRRAVERILEDESLTADLTDYAARTLLDWGVAQAQRFSGELETGLVDLRRAMKRINQVAGKAAPEVQTEWVRALLAEIETQPITEEVKDDA